MGEEWSGRWQWGRGMATEVSQEQGGVIWCRSCGIPHDAEATHCSFCSQPLAEDIESDGVNAAAGTEATDAGTGALGRALADRVAAQRPPRKRSAGPWSLPGLRQPLSDDEIDARAAAIVAQARKEEASGEAKPLFVTGPGVVSDDDLLELEFLPPLRQRDREWLLAGLICCVLLIMGAVAIVRFFAA